MDGRGPGCQYQLGIEQRRSINISMDNLPKKDVAAQGAFVKTENIKDVLTTGFL